jgi:hypothetical protein
MYVFAECFVHCYRAQCVIKVLNFLVLAEAFFRVGRGLWRQRGTLRAKHCNEIVFVVVVVVVGGGKSINFIKVSRHNDVSGLKNFAHSN